MYLFFDTETTGLPLNWNAPISDLENWPRLVQIAWLQYDESGKEIKNKVYIIKPEKFFIPAESARVHGITTDLANEKGISLEAALNEFSADLNDSQILIAHNMNFDEKIIGAEFLRKSVNNNLSNIKKFCTMTSSTDFCEIPGKGKFKFPKLQELYFKLFAKNFDDAHDASVDTKACAKCFFELKKKKIIKDPLAPIKKRTNALAFSQGIFNF
ncbi:3'-5' exonuclease [bacterium]|nr:3'-5' exonuclease [bacterium]